MNKEISYNTYRDSSLEYEKALSWMMKIGIKYESSRVSNYQKSLDELILLLESKDQVKINSRFAELVNTAHEVDSIIKIYKSLNVLEINENALLLDKLKRSIVGPIDIGEESSKNSAARNYLFEVMVASKFNNPAKGLNVEFIATNDLKLSYRDYSYLIECKRIESPKKLIERVKEAKKQILRALDNSIKVKTKGIIVVDISKIINPEFGLSVKQTPRRLRRHITQEMDKFIYENSNSWQSKLKSVSKKIPAIVFYCSFMGVSESTHHLFKLEQWVLNPVVGANSSQENIFRDMVNVLDNK